MKNLKCLIASLLFMSTAAMSGRGYADIVVLTNHNEMEGIIISENEKEVVLKVRNGKISFPRDLVKSIARDDDKRNAEIENKLDHKSPSVSDPKMSPKKDPVSIKRAKKQTSVTQTNSKYSSKKKVGDKVDVRIEGDRIYVDGQRFFVRGIGYGPYRPGMSPGQKVSTEIYEKDFERIRACGFNTIRVWGTAPKELLEAALRYDLKVIQAVWIDPGGSFGYSGFIYQSIGRARMMAEASRDYPNVIMYLIMNEPHVDAVMKAGIEETLTLYKKVISTIKEIDPDRPISISNFLSTVWLDQSLWDVICFNAYGYYPVSLNADVGFDGYVRWLKEEYSFGKPLLITEYGYSVSPGGPGELGYGGNTLDEQAQGVVSNFDEISQSGAIGGCLFEWCDEWWKSGDPGIHNNNPEEWFGLMEFINREDLTGRPRDAYHAMKKAMRMAVIRPQKHVRVSDKLDIELNVMEDIKQVQYSIDDEPGSILKRKGPWISGKVDISALSDGLHFLHLQGTGGGGVKVAKKIPFIKDTKTGAEPVSLTLNFDKEQYQVGDTLDIKLSVKDHAGKPQSGYPVSLSIYNCLSSNTRRWTGITGKDGTIEQSYLALGGRYDWYYIISGGTGYMVDDAELKTGQIKTVFVKGGLDLIPRKELMVPRKKGEIIIDGILEEEWDKCKGLSLIVDEVFVEGEVDSAEDLGLKGHVLWDPENIYVAFDITDDKPLVNSYENDMIWNGDAVELFISMKPELIPDYGYGRWDYQMILASNGKMWIYNQARGGVRNGPPEKSEIKVRKSENGYVIEARISTYNFFKDKPELLEEGMLLGLDLAVADADNSKSREGKMIWNGIGENFKNSVLWGRAKLGE